MTTKSTIKFALCGAALAAFTLPGVASAMPGFGPGGPIGPNGKRCVPPPIAKALKTHDANNNGKLEPSEFYAFRRWKQQQMHTMYDLNHDGQLDDSELKAMRDDRIKGHFDDLDSNSDGVVTDAEAKASCTPLAHHFGRVDANGDGKITLAEFRAKAPGKRMRPPRGPRA